MKRLALLFIVSMGAATHASAQNWSFDARSVALGGGAGPETLAMGMVDARRRDSPSIVLPIGLIQLARDWDRLNPTNDDFDIVRTIEYAASPFHYVVGRDDESPISQFAIAVRQGRLSRDLNDYRGVVIPNSLDMGGLSMPQWSVTIPLYRSSGLSHGLYLGAGPYFAMRNGFTIDRQLTGILASDTPTYVPNAQLPLVTTTQGQTAVAFTGGYRGKVASLAALGGGSESDGVYVAVNYNYLRGFRYEDVGLRLNLATDGAGLLTLTTPGGSPLVVGRDHATSGGGTAVDLGAAVVVDRWAVGFSATGIGNHIDWSDVERTTYELGSLFASIAQFLESRPVPVGDVRVELPVDYRASVGYDGQGWAALADLGRGFNGTSFHGGLEKRLGWIDVRGGGAYSRERWTPTAGVGLNFSRKVSLDTAIYGSTANIERKRRLAIAMSLGINP